jgi:integrase
VRQHPGILSTFVSTFKGKRTKNRLTPRSEVLKMPKLQLPKAAKFFENAKHDPAKHQDRPAFFADGGGLFLMATPEGSKRWIFRYRFEGKQKKLSIKGGFPAVSLKAARDEAERLREMVARGEDPGEARKAVRAKVQETEAAKAAEEAHQAATFEAVARLWHDKKTHEVASSTAQWILHCLESDLFPWIGSKPIADIRPPEVLKTLQRIEDRGARVTAHRASSICSQVFRYGVATGVLESDPCRDLKGALKKVDAGHFAALTRPEDVAGLLRAVDAYRGSPETRAAIFLGILTFVRPGNLQKAEWTEFHDLENPEKAEWRIPGIKMKVKTDRPFVVPLAPQAINLLNELHPLTGRSAYVFPSARTPARPMSNMAVLGALRRMGYTSDEMTGHGVRAMARTITHEVLGFAPEVIEEQLAHGKAGPLGGAYDRTTHMPERRRLMREWADYLDALKAAPTPQTIP